MTKQSNVAALLKLTMRMHTSNGDLHAQVPQWVRILIAAAARPGYATQLMRRAGAVSMYKRIDLMVGDGLLELAKPFGRSLQPTAAGVEILETLSKELAEWQAGVEAALDEHRSRLQAEARDDADRQKPTTSRDKIRIV